jgi:GNAT superfamily N-acetyltransferase
MAETYAFIGPYIEPGMLDRRPYLCFRVECYDSRHRLYSGQVSPAGWLGYLRVEWVDSKLFDEYFPSYWHYVNEMHGWCLGLNKDKDWKDPNILPSLWKSSHLYAQASPRSRPKCAFWMLDSCSASYDEMISDMEFLAPRTRWFRGWRKSMRPEYSYVGYIKVNDLWQRRGIGTKMYELAAMWLAVNRGEVLHASSIRTDKALAVWDKLYERGYPVYKMRASGNKWTPVLDYTDPLLLNKAKRKISRVETIIDPEMIYLE